MSQFGVQFANGPHKRRRRLWEDRFKSVIVESGTVARTMAAYIDLNPVRAGMVEDPAEYRWSSYGEAVGGGRKGNGKKARAGLTRIIDSQRSDRNGEGEEVTAVQWKRVSWIYRRTMGLALDRKALNSRLQSPAKVTVRKNEGEVLATGDDETVMGVRAL